MPGMTSKQGVVILSAVRKAVGGPGVGQGIAAVIERLWA